MVFGDLLARDTYIVFRLLLIQEKEQLLRELRGLNKRNLDEDDSDSVDHRIRQLNADLQSAMQVSSRQIAERLRLNEAKSTILQKLAEATKLTTYLEAQLKRYTYCWLQQNVFFCTLLLPVGFRPMTYNGYLCPVTGLCPSVTFGSDVC